MFKRKNRLQYIFKEKIKKIIQTSKKGEAFMLIVPEGKQCFENKKSRSGFTRWLSGKFGKAYSITENTIGAERYVPHNKIKSLLCDSDRIEKANN